MNRTQSCDVLIVGLGPVGATLSALLGDAGVDVLAIDKSSEVYPLPRAAHFDHEIMRVFQQLGIAEAVLQHAQPATGYEFRSASGEVLLSLDTRPDAFAPSGWASGYMFNQPGLERALRAKLADQPTVRTLLNATFQKLETTVGGVQATIVDSEGPLTVQARYLVGCDGAWSPVREAIGGKLDDLQFDEPWLVIDAIPRPGAKMPEVNLQICDPARPTTCVLMGPGRHRWEFMLLPGETAEAVLDEAFIQSLLAGWEVDVEIERKAVYRFHGLVADRWRSGPVLLAGDAAHQTPPFAGQGMCAGVRDAANLAWKLTAVLAGQADDALLDTYQTEREPNARAYIALAINMGRVVCALDPEIAKMRDAQMLAARAAGIPPMPPAAPPPITGPAVLTGTPAAGELFPQPVARQAGGAVLRLDDVLGAESWLITTASLEEPRLTPFRESLAAWLEAHDVPAVLVRPDRHVFGSGAPELLTTAWANALRAAPVAA